MEFPDEEEKIRSRPESLAGVSGAIGWGAIGGRGQARGKR